MTCRLPNGGSFPFSDADGQAKAGKTYILCVLALENLAPDIARHLMNLRRKSATHVQDAHPVPSEENPPCSASSPSPSDPPLRSALPL